jgi:hypothetical protein
MRDIYDNDFIRDMFFMHDFVHMIFDNPLQVHGLTFEYFSEIVNTNEWVASNETETLTYYRIPQMRENSLPYTIMFDLLQSSGYEHAPTPEFLLNLRKSIMFENSDGGMGSHPDASNVFSYLRKFKENNALWCKLWYEHFPKISKPYAERRLCLPLLTYEEILLNYKTLNSEERYQKNILLNIRTALEMVGETDLPNTFAACEQAVKHLEGKIIMKEVAAQFHELYIKNKNK